MLPFCHSGHDDCWLRWKNSSCFPPIRKGWMLTLRLSGSVSTDRQQWFLHTHCACLFGVWCSHCQTQIPITLLWLCFCMFLTYLHRDVLFLAGFLWGEDIRDFFVRRGLAANGTLNGASMRPHAVLLDNNWNAFITEAVPTGQHCPLKEKTHTTHLSEMPSEMPSNYTCIKGDSCIISLPKYFMILIF